MSCWNSQGEDKSKKIEYLCAKCQQSCTQLFSYRLSLKTSLAHEMETKSYRKLFLIVSGLNDTIRATFYTKKFNNNGIKDTNSIEPPWLLPSSNHRQLVLGGKRCFKGKKLNGHQFRSVPGTARDGFFDRGRTCSSTRNLQNQTSSPAKYVANDILEWGR